MLKVFILLTVCYFLSGCSNKVKWTTSPVTRTEYKKQPTESKIIKYSQKEFDKKKYK